MGGDISGDVLDGVAGDAGGEEHVFTLELVLLKIRAITGGDDCPNFSGVDVWNVPHLDEVPGLLAGERMDVNVGGTAVGVGFRVVDHFVKIFTRNGTRFLLVNPLRFAKLRLLEV